MDADRTPASHNRTRCWRRVVAGGMLGAGIVLTQAGGAWSQLASGAFGNSTKDRGLKVSIEANVLDVDQKKRQAVFTGNVIAIRGTVKLTSKRLVVHYSERRSKSGKSRTEVTRLNAYDNVVVINANKKATGQWATMHMKSGKVYMGDAVILSENRSVLRGSRLELDLKTGKSRLLGAKNNRNRVFGIFVPEPVRK